MDLLTPLDTYCRLILRAKELEAQVPALDPDDDPDNVNDFDDDGGGEERIDELMDMPLLAGYLEAGLAAFDYSCEGVAQQD